MRYVPRFIRSTALATAVAVTVGLAGAGPALAQTTLSVTVTGGGTFAASASPATFAVGNVSIACNSSAASVTISNQTTSGPAPLSIGTAVGFAFTNCTGPLGPVTVTATSSSYQIAANSTTSSGKTDLTVGAFDLGFSMTGCSFTVSGTAPGSYDNVGHAMGMGPIPPVPPVKKVQLTISKVAGCVGLVTNGQEMDFPASYALSLRALKGVTLHIVSKKG